MKRPKCGKNRIYTDLFDKKKGCVETLNAAGQDQKRPKQIFQDF